MVAEFFASVGDGLMREAARPPDGAGAVDVGCAPGHAAGDRAAGQDADAFYQKRVPKGAPDYLRPCRSPSPRDAPPTRDLSDRDRGPGGAPTWGPSSSTVAGPPRRRRPPLTSCIDLDPQPGTSFSDAVRSRRGTRAASRFRARGYPKTSGTAACTSTCASSHAGEFTGRAARGDRVRPRAGAARRRRDGRLVEGGGVASASSSTSTRTTATGRSPPPTPLRPSPRRHRCRHR